MRLRAPLLLSIVALVVQACSAARDEAREAKGRYPDRNLYRLFLQMDGGGFQNVDIDNSRFLAGEAVELTNDGRVVRVTGTTLDKAVGGSR